MQGEVFMLYSTPDTDEQVHFGPYNVNEVENSAYSSEIQESLLVFSVAADPANAVEQMQELKGSSFEPNL